MLSAQPLEKAIAQLPRPCFPGPFGGHNPLLGGAEPMQRHPPRPADRRHNGRVPGRGFAPQAVIHMGDLHRQAQGRAAPQKKQQKGHGVGPA